MLRPTVITYHLHRFLTLRAADLGMCLAFVSQFRRLSCSNASLPNFVSVCSLSSPTLNHLRYLANFPQ